MLFYSVELLILELTPRHPHTIVVSRPQRESYVFFILHLQHLTAHGSSFNKIKISISLKLNRNLKKLVILLQYPKGLFVQCTVSFRTVRTIESPPPPTPRVEQSCTRYRDFVTIPEVRRNSTSSQHYRSLSNKYR
jgi:hypothetical protein